MAEEKKIVFSPPDITEEEIREVADALRSGWITTGPRTKKLEEEMAAYCHTNRFVCLNSATASMEMAYRLFGIGEGDEVITTAYTYTATASAICHTGAKPVIVDVLGDKADERHSPFEIDPEAVAKAITPRTRAIAPVDIGGVMCDYEPLLRIAKEHRSSYKPTGNRFADALGRILVLADSAHGFGSTYDGRSSGEYADVTTFSFHAVKNLTTAEGGGITWQPLPGIDDEDIYHQLQLLSLHGQSKDALAKEEIGGWEYDIEFPGYKCNITDVQAAIGLVQIRRYPELLEKRRRIIERYDRGLQAIEEDLRQSGNKAERFVPIRTLKHFDEIRNSSGHLYLVRIGDLTHEERSDIITQMAKRGIPTNVHYKPLPLLTAYKNIGYDIADYPRAYSLYKNEITLPLHTLLSDEDVDRIIDTLKEVLYASVG